MSYSVLDNRISSLSVNKLDFYAIGGLALCLLYAGAVVLIVVASGGPFGYPLDDTYIHMAMARTIATAGVWGVTPAAPAAASSSPLWTLLLAGAYMVTKGWAFLYVPMLLNVVAACGLITLLIMMFRQQPASIALVAAIVFAVALPSLSVIGMEHVLHMLIAVALCFVVCQTIAEPSEKSIRLVLIGILALLCVAARYESLFLVGPLIALATARRRWRIAIALGLGAALPLLAFGALWSRDGGWFVPNSLILKKRLTDNTGLVAAIRQTFGNLVSNLKTLPYRRSFGAMLIGLIALLVFYVTRQKQIWKLPVLFALSALVATGGHLVFASVGWLYRYESWLIVLDLAAICLLAECVLGPRSLLGLAAAIVLVFSFRTVDATSRTARAIDDRRLEHLSPAHFLDLNYSGETVMLNDLGAVAWFAPRTRILDIFGLGNNEPVRLRLRPEGYDSAALRDWAVRSGARIAMVQACWNEINTRIPAEWTLVATWRIPRNVVFGDPVVAFFAIVPDEQKTLRHNLETFPTPPGVTLNLDSPRAALLDGCNTFALPSRH